MNMSHPAWVCGLKPLSKIPSTMITVVTPCVGVWIETPLISTNNALLLGVTPCVGVWIETISFSAFSINKEVTPCVGVWIETIKEENNFVELKSHPAWVCGLKHKLGRSRRGFTIVTPCVGVWIETVIGIYLSSALSHTLRGCVD